MVANTSPIFGATPQTTGTQFTNATSTTVTTICTAGANGSIVESVIAVTSDSAANDCNLYIQHGGSGTTFNIGGKRVPAGSGDVVASTTPAVQLLDPAQIAGLLADGTLKLGANDKLAMGVVAAVTTAKTLTITVLSTDF